MSDQAQKIDEAIEVVDYNPEWPHLFEQEAERLKATIGRKINAIYIQ